MTIEYSNHCGKQVQHLNTRHHGRPRRTRGRLLPTLRLTGDVDCPAAELLVGMPPVGGVVVNGVVVKGVVVCGVTVRGVVLCGVVCCGVHVHVHVRGVVVSAVVLSKGLVSGGVVYLAADNGMGFVAGVAASTGEVCAEAPAA